MVVALLITCTLLLNRQAAGQAAAPESSAPFLHADGTVLRDRTGKAVQLRGVNLGGWLKLEGWMCPVDTSKTLRDGNSGHNGYDFEVRRLLVRRFGENTASKLIHTYEDAWITTADLDQIQALGFNVIRVPFAYSTLMHEDGTWRGDAFDRLDWVVQQAWQRGIYTVLDYHAFLPPAADHDGSAQGYFASAAQKAQTVSIWKKIAEHYRNSPAVAMYDLLNEPSNSSPKGRMAPKPETVCDLYDEIYRAIRSVDRDHLIAMEGMWDWKTLRDPHKKGYRNVVYSFHWYPWGSKTTLERNRATDDHMASIAAMQKVWKVPAYVGEFNQFGDVEAWRYAIEKFDQQKLNWTLWTYKHTASGSNAWGVCTTIPGKGPRVPNLTTDSAEEIRAKWNAWRTTDQTFALNPMLAPLLRKVGNEGKK